jgi:hypothetical protein
MFEEKKNKTGRSFALKIFVDMPWVVRAYFHLLIVFIVAIIVMAVADSQLHIPLFASVVEKMASFLELILGAVLGALSVAAKQHLKQSSGRQS